MRSPLSRREDPPPVFGGKGQIAEAIRYHDRLSEYVSRGLESPWDECDACGDVEATMDTAKFYEFTHCMNNRDYRVSGRPVFIRFPGREGQQVRGNNERARIAGSDYCLTDTQWQRILSEFHYKCAYCGRADGLLQLDHLVSVFCGGGTEKWNVVPACRDCNNQKGAKDPLVYLGPRHLEELRMRLRRANP